MAKHKCPIVECPKHEKPISKINNVRRHFLTKHGMDLEGWLEAHWPGGVKAWYEQEDLDLPEKYKPLTEPAEDPIEDPLDTFDEETFKQEMQAQLDEVGLKINPASSIDDLVKAMTSTNREDQLAYFKKIGLLVDATKTPEEVMTPQPEPQDTTPKTTEDEEKPEEIDVDAIMTSDAVFIGFIAFLVLVSVFVTFIAYKRHQDNGKVF